MKRLSVDRYLEGLSADAVQRVVSNLNATNKGHDKDLVSPLIGKDDPAPDDKRQVLGLGLLGEVTPSGLHALDELEREQFEKIGPYSIQQPFEDRLPTVEAYFGNKDESRMDQEGLDYAFDQLMKIMPTRRIEPIDAYDAFLNMPHGTNLGAPFFTSDNSARDAVLELAEMVIDSGFRLDFGDPCSLYSRTQPRGYHEIPKQRVVWGYPHYITIIELMIQMALLPYLSSKIEFSAWNVSETVDVAVTYIMGKATTDIISVDFSSFDQSVNETLIHMAFDAIRAVFTTRSESLIDYVESQFLNIGLMTPIGIFVDRQGSVPSGSGLTNLIDSFVHIIAAHYCAYMTRNEVSLLVVQGDDGIWLMRRPFEFDDIRSAAADLGLTLNDDKGGLSRENVYFLQNLHSLSYTVNGLNVGVRPIMRSLNGMLSYERLTKPWTAYDDTVRWLQQAESCKYHPKFPALANFLYTHDMFIQNMDLTTILRKGGGIGRIESDLKQSGFPYGKSPLSGIMQFAVVRQIDQLKVKHRKSGA